MYSFFIGTILFALGGLIAIFLKEKFKSIVCIFFSFAAQFFILPPAFGILMNGGISEATLYFSEPIANASIRLDPLAAMFVILISLGGLLASVYSHGYMKMYSGLRSSLSSYYFFLGLMISSMLLVVTVQNAILFLIVWEFMSLTSFFLVSFENKKEEVRKAAMYYFIAMQIGAAFLIAAFSWCVALSGSPDFDSFRPLLNEPNRISILLFLLFFIGFGTKAGFVPMHTWLPRAHPAAPTGVSALMSGVMIKTGIYGILRILLLMGTPDVRLAYVVFILSLLTGIFGVLNAIAQHDLKKLLAFHSIENIGIIGMGIGLGMLGLAYHVAGIAVLGFLGGLLHVINHFTFKSVLFYGSGVVYSQLHTRNIDVLGGLGKYLPVTSVLFLISSLAISGMPLLNGFISEFSIYLGIVKGFSLNNLSMNVAALLGMSGLAFIGIMALLCFTKVYGICFLGSSRTELHTAPDEKSISLLLPMIALTIVIFFIGLFPSVAVLMHAHVLNQFLPAEGMSEFYNLIPTYQLLTYMFALFTGLVLIFFLMRSRLLKGKQVRKFKTWDCGYQAGTPRMQYTGSSFAQPFLHLVRELVPQKIKVRKEPLLFLKEAHLESHSQDFSERLFIQPSVRFLNKFMNMFSWIQSGRMQQYIIYGLLFLIFLLIWIIGTA